MDLEQKYLKIKTPSGTIPSGKYAALFLAKIFTTSLNIYNFT